MMRAIIPVTCPPNCHHRMALLSCVIFIVVFPALLAINPQKIKHGNTYERKAENNAEFSRSSKQSEDFTVGDKNNDSAMKGIGDHGNGRSNKATGEASPALNKFLDDVLKAQNDLKWIDQVVHDANRGKDSEKNNHQGDKAREKRGFNEIYANNRNYEYNYTPGPSQIMSMGNDMTNKGGIDQDNMDMPFYGIKEKDIYPSFQHDKDLMNDQLPKYWSKTKDLCSLNDWLNSNKNSENVLEKSGDQWNHKYDSHFMNSMNSLDFGSRENMRTDARLNVRNQRDEAKRNETPSLESLKETIMQLKKRLNEGDKRQQKDSREVDTEKTADRENNKVDATDRKTRSRNKHRKSEAEDDASSNWRDKYEVESLDLKKRQPGPEVSKELNTHSWRSRRTGADNDNGKSKLFHRSAVSEPYFQGDTLKEFHDRKRRSKETQANKNLRATEEKSKNNDNAEEKHSTEASRSSSCADVPNSNNFNQEILSNDLQQGSNVFDQENNPTNNLGDSVNSQLSNSLSGNGEVNEKNKNDIKSDVTQENQNIVENKLMQNQQEGEIPERNSLQTFDSMTNEMQAVSSTETSKENTVGKEEAAGETRIQGTGEKSRENDGPRKGEQVNKVFLPQAYLYQNNERTKKVRASGTESDENHRKLLEPPAQEKRSTKDLGNVNLLLKSENTNTLRLSKTDTNGNSNKNDGRSPLILNVFDIKKKMVMENEDGSGKSVSSVYNVKIEKAQVDTTVRRNENHKGNSILFGNRGLDIDRNNVKDKLHEDTSVSQNDMRRRNVNEKPVKDTTDFSKDLSENVGKSATGNWLGIADHNELGTSVDQDTIEKCNKQDEKDKYKNDIIQINEDNEKPDVIQDGSYNENSKDEGARRKTKKKYTEIFIVPDGLDDRVTNDRYGRRRLLQYMEYSNDDVEDADASYNDKEEEEETLQANADKNAELSRRRERAPHGDKKKAKVNMLIHDKVSKKKRPYRRRIRRDPSVIEYYDYDSDVEPQDHELLSPTSEQERSKNNYEDKSAIESNVGFDNEISHSLIPPAEKTDEHEKEIMKQEKEKEKLKNKQPKQEFIAIDRPNRKNTTGTAILSTKVKFAEDRGSFGEKHLGSRSQKPAVNNEEVPSQRDAKEMVSDSIKSILNVGKDLDPSSIDDFIEDLQSADEKNEKISNNVGPWYEEIKKVYDWSETDGKKKPRIKGDQRMYDGGRNEKLELTNRAGDSLNDQIEHPEIHNSIKMSGSSPNLWSLLLVFPNGSGKSDFNEKNNDIKQGRVESLTASNVSKSNYFALKNTDDMFKGGLEQNNNTEEKIRGSNAIKKVTEWQPRKVRGTGKDAMPEKDAATGWSLTEHRQYIDTDSCSPYKNRKYLVPQLPHEWKRDQNTNGEKEAAINSLDLHESFVEPLDWDDDFEKDIRIRLSRSLKSIEANTMIFTQSSTKKLEPDATNSSIENLQSTNSVSSTLYTIEPSLELRKLYQNTVRQKRDLSYSYDFIYDDINQQNPHFEGVNVDQDSKNKDAADDNHQVLHPYGIIENMHQKISNLRDREDEDEYFEDDKDDYGKVIRSTDVEKEKRHANKQKLRDSKHKKRRGKKSKKSHRKRRHHKKHSIDSKKKNHDHGHKKKRKRTSKHASHHNVKKSKASQNVKKDHGHHYESSRKRHSMKVKKKNVIRSGNKIQKNKISSLLATDNIDDESQIQLALHGELAAKIVQQIFDQVHKNENLKRSLGPGLYQKHKTMNDIIMKKTYRQARDNDEVKHTEELLSKIMVLLNRLIFDEVQRKSCIPLTPDLMEFLEWILDVSPKNSTKQLPHPPEMPKEKPLTLSQNKLLFRIYPNQDMEREINEMYTKIRMIKGLIKEYSELSDADKKEIHSIQDFLSKQLDLLLEYIEAKEDDEKRAKSFLSSVTAKEKNDGFLRYQIGVNNASNSYYSTKPYGFRSPIKTPHALKLKNMNSLDNELFRDNDINISQEMYRIARSLDKDGVRNKEQRNRKKRKGKHSKRHKGVRTIDQSRRKDFVHKAQRQKREYSDEGFWDSDLGYEEPLIYTSIDIPNIELNGRSISHIENENSVRDTSKANVRSQEEGKTNYLKDREIINAMEVTKSDEDALKELAKSQRNAGNNINDEKELSHEQEEPITGKNRLEDEILLLNKRQAWKQENEQQLEEVAFGEDMRKAVKDKKLFEELTEIDKKKSDEKYKKEMNGENCVTNSQNDNSSLSNEEKLRLLERQTNVYADNE